MSAQKGRGNDKKDIAASLHAGLGTMTGLLRDVELPKGLTPERLRTLTNIQTHGPITVTALAELEGLRPATISRMIASLETQDLVRRSADKNDKRSVFISTTAKGRQVYQRASDEYLKHIREAIGNLEPEQAKLVSSLVTLLGELGSAINR